MIYSIMPAQACHLHLLAAVEQAAASLFPPGSIPDAIRGDSLPLSMLEQAVLDKALWVAVPDDDPGTPVGFALLGRAGPFPLLAQVDVHPNHGRRGIGRRLVNTVIDAMRCASDSYLFLTTFSDVPWNAPFYASMGFRVVDEAHTPEPLAVILTEERSRGLQNRIAMSLHW